MTKIIISIIINKFNRSRICRYIYSKLLCLYDNINIYLKIPNSFFFNLVDIVISKILFFYFKFVCIINLFSEFIFLSIKKLFKDLILFKKHLSYAFNLSVVVFLRKILNFRNYIINNFLFLLFYSRKIVNKFFKNVSKKRFFRKNTIIFDNINISVNQTFVVFIKSYIKSYYFYLNLFFFKIITKIIKFLTFYFLLFYRLFFKIKLLVLAATDIHLQMFYKTLNELSYKFVYFLENYVLLILNFVEENFTFIYTNILLLLKPRPYNYKVSFSSSYKLFKFEKIKKYIYRPIKFVLIRYYDISLDYTDEYLKFVSDCKELIFFLPRLLKNIFLSFVHFFYNFLPNFFLKKLLKIWFLIVKIHTKYELFILDLKRIYAYCFWSLLIFIMYVFGRGNVYYFKREDTILYIKEVFLWIWMMFYNSYWFVHSKTEVWLFKWLYFSLRILVKMFKVAYVFDPLRVYKKNVIFYFLFLIKFINRDLFKLVIFFVYMILVYNFFSSIILAYYVSKVVSFLDFFYYLKIISLYYYFKRLRERFINYKVWKRMRWRRRRKFLKKLVFLDIMWKFYNKKIYKLKKKKRRRYKVYRKTTLKYEMWKIKNQTWTFIKLILRSSWYWFLHAELDLEDDFNLFEDYSCSI